MFPSELPEPILLGYRPRRPWVPESTFSVPGVTVASASDCLMPAVLPDEPDWEHMNTALHYDSVGEATTAATKRGETAFEVHATRLWPVLFDGSQRQPFVLDLKRFDQSPCHVDAVARSNPLGFDVVSVSAAEFKGTDNRCDHLPFDCAPLSCNGMGAEIAVNRWCLLERIEDAVAAATRFAKEEPEPGPFVIVQVLRCET